jgi:GAF domain-containing protein
LGKGVCGTAWQNKQTIIVPNVEEFPGHIACSSLSKSEIVIPVFNSQTNKVQMVLDVDSDKLNFFDSIDALYLQQLAKIAGNLS